MLLLCMLLFLALRSTKNTPPSKTTNKTTHDHQTKQYSASSVRSRVSLVFQLLSFYCLMPYISMGLYASDKKFYLADASSQLAHRYTADARDLSRCASSSTAYPNRQLATSAGASASTGS